VHPREIYGDPTRSPTAKLQLNDSVQRRPPPAADGPGPRRCITQISGRPADLNLGWNFRTKEGVSLQIPAEFVSIFNRTQIGNPSTSNPLGGPIQDKNSGKHIGGFGVINDFVADGATPSYQAKWRGGTVVPAAAHRHSHRARSDRHEFSTARPSLLKCDSCPRPGRNAGIRDLLAGHSCERPQRGIR
jgi:hypothetical protein